MSHHIPFEIQVEIMQNLPIKPLIRFTLVSKLWKSVIYSSKFIAHYKHQHHLVAIYKDLEDNEVKYVSILDDDTFPKHKLFHTVPMSIDPHYQPSIVGCSEGLLCLYRSDTNTAVLWNPAIRKSVAINMPNVPKSLPDYRTVIAFGVCPNTCDPKLVQITFHLGLSETINWQVKLFTLSTRAWRSIYMPGISVVLNHSHITINGFIYWKAFQDNGSVVNCRVIMSYDMTSEEFTEINLPHSLAFCINSSFMSISKLRESLVVLEYFYKAAYYDVWVMENGTPRSFKKIFNFKKPDAPIQNEIGFRKNGEVIYLRINSSEVVALFVYEPYSEHKLDIEVYGKNILYVSSSCYMETLLLLDQ